MVLPSKLESVFSHHAFALSTKFMVYSKSFVVLSTIFTVSSPRVDSISRNHFPASLLEATPPPFKLYADLAAIQSHLQALLLVLLLLLPLSSLTSSPKVFNPSVSFLRTGINFFFQSPVYVDI